MSHHRKRNPQGSAQRIADLWLYLQGVKEIEGAEELAFIYTVARQHWAGKSWRARQHECARMAKCSLATIKRRLPQLYRGGWVKKEWRGGHQSNVYAPGWRLSQLMARAKK